MTEVAREDLPIWMQKSLRGTDWGVLIVLAFCVLAAWPFLLQPGLPRTNASEHYVFRTADTAQTFADGRFYSRWSPNTVSAYGAPIPNYYPPGAAYFPALLDVAFTNNAALAVKLTYAMALCLAGAAVYAFVNRRASAAAGVIAALLYVYSPYLGLVAPHLLGDLPGVVSLALIPALLWSVDRVLRVNHAFDLLYVVLATAGLLLTDIPAAVLGWLLAAALVAQSADSFPRWYLIPIGALLGVALAAFYWLPALAESDAVQWYARPDTLAGTLTLGGLLAPLLPVDPGALIPERQFTLGLTLPLLTLLSVPLMLRGRLNFHSLFLALGLALAVLALTVFPSETWTLGVISLCFAIAASAIVTWKRTPFLPPLLAIVILLAAAPNWIALRWPQESMDASPLAQVEYEQLGYGIAGLPAGDALPSSIPPDSAPNRALIASYRAGSVAKAEGIAGAQIGVLDHNSYGDRLQLQSSAALTLHYLTAWFPGWTASLNSLALNLSPADDGLMSVEIPGRARGELAITLETTLPRTLGWGISWVALVVVGVVTLARTRQPGVPDRPLDLLPRRQAQILGLLVVAFALLLGLVAFPNAPMRVQVHANYRLNGSKILDNRSDAGLELLAVRTEQQHYQRGDTVHLEFYWHTIRFLSENYGVRVSLLDLSSGVYRDASDLRIPGGYPTRRWVPGFYVIDDYSLTLPPEFPPGNYSPALEVCRDSSSGCAAQDSPLTFFSGTGQEYGQVLVVPIILNVE